MKIGAVGLGNRIAHVYHELSQINKDAELIAYQGIIGEFLIVFRFRGPKIMDCLGYVGRGEEDEGSHFPQFPFVSVVYFPCWPSNF